MRRTCDISMEFLDHPVCCVGNTFEGKEGACSRGQSLTTVLNVLETCGRTHERARTLCCHSDKRSSRMGDRSMRDSCILFLLSPPGRMLRVALGIGGGSDWGTLHAGQAGFVVAVIGLIPIFATLAGVCFLRPLFGYIFEGQKRERPVNSSWERAFPL